jgi:CMP-N,N'-diacetyllegionaminic acid synthase
MTFRERTVIALIPARGGSKGVPRKNLREFRGKPLLLHTVQAAQESQVVDEVCVSSDDEEILAAASAAGARAVRRPAEMATDQATAADVVASFSAQLPAEVLRADPFLVYLQPTSPLRSARHIDSAFDSLSSAGADTGLSVVELRRTPYKSFTVDEHGRLRSLFAQELSNANRQSLPVAYYPNGAIYIFPLSRFMAGRAFPSNGGVPFVMSEHESVDIDTEADFLAAETISCPN